MEIEDLDMIAEYETIKKAANKNGVLTIDECDIDDHSFKVLDILTSMNLLDYMVFHDSITLAYNIVIYIREYDV